VADTEEERVLRDEGGFTLMELLVVLGIIALLAAVVAPQVMRYMGDARSKTATAQLKNIEGSLELYYLDTGTYPSADVGLSALVDPQAGVPGWRGPYLKKREALLDPWGRSYVYRVPGEHGAFDLSSMGRDGKQGGEGEDRDILNW
jgi:general secretion pathway protein G